MLKFVDNNKAMMLSGDPTIDPGFDEYDIVEGGVANDNVIDTVEDYEKGIITAEQALGQLRYKNVNHQICILSQQVIDRYLEFVECLTIQAEEDM
jgi:hypothetical protein